MGKAAQLETLKKNRMYTTASTAESTSEKRRPGPHAGPRSVILLGSCRSLAEAGGQCACCHLCLVLHVSTKGLGIRRSKQAGLYVDNSYRCREHIREDEARSACRTQMTGHSFSLLQKSCRGRWSMRMLPSLVHHFSTQDWASEEASGIACMVPSKAVR